VTGQDDGPKVAIVMSSEIDAQGGTLNADYWVNRLPGETYPQFQARRQAEHMERRADHHEAVAARLRADAAQLRADSAQNPEEGTTPS
jgi:hypothetical protein